MAQQFFGLRSNLASKGEGRLRGNVLTWRGEIAPSVFSRVYDVRIEYRQDQLPQVFIDRPDLTALASGRKLPHVYDQRPTRLCLYLPGSGEWDPSHRLDQTLVPWTALWLLYFEEWLLSDSWAGGGLHPTTSRRKPRRSKPKPSVVAGEGNL